MLGRYAEVYDAAQPRVASALVRMVRVDSELTPEYCFLEEGHRREAGDRCVEERSEWQRATRIACRRQPQTKPRAREQPEAARKASSVQPDASGHARRMKPLQMAEELEEADLMREALKMQSEAIRARGDGPDEGGTQDAIRGNQSSRRRT